ncbi:MAG TPA: 6-phosphogluconolactonase [Mycobacteriales bacterium]|nr:6-phosphogluconolactonase [Mycobacteriales bacterium]
MSTPSVLVHRDADLLAQAVAARLVTRIVDTQSAKGSASLVLTGGEIGIATLSALAASAARDAIDWAHLDLYWGDERFLPSGHPDRNETQARAALLDRVSLDPARVRPMPASDDEADDGSGSAGQTRSADPEAAAERYTALLARAARPEDHGPVPEFDVLLLGVGPDGHTASLFPGLAGVHDERPVIAVRGAPKPPPTRLSLGFSALNAARETWVVVAGADKAGAVALALSGAGRTQVPAAGVRGRQRTLWLLDRAAAAHLPATLPRLASP